MGTYLIEVTPQVSLKEMDYLKDAIWSTGQRKIVETCFSHIKMTFKWIKELHVQG